MKKTLIVAAVAAAMFTFTAPANADNQWIGPVLGGVAGGFVGNQFGSGRGNTVATAVGAVGGVLLGQEMVRKNSAPARTPTMPNGTVFVGGPCDGYYNPGARAACARGLADRQAQLQVQIERQAYYIARGQRGRGDGRGSDWGRSSVRW